MEITCNGAAKKVTGSCYHIKTQGKELLIDCGLFQGNVQEEKHNKDDFTFIPKDLSFIIVTHSHIDHTGRLPLLVKEGFYGKIFMTPPTKELTSLLLLDSASIQEQKALEDPNYTPLYTTDDVYTTISLFYPVSYDQLMEENGISFTFKNAGHLLGSAFVELETEEKTITFSGDLGHQKSILYPGPSQRTTSDYLFVESTYGNRLHPPMDKRTATLYNLIISSIQNGETVIIPVFAVGRTQEILYALKTYAEEEGLADSWQKIPVYVDSPMGIAASKLYEELAPYNRYHEALGLFDQSNYHYLEDPEEAYGLNFNPQPKVILSSSGMCEAGRIVGHLEHYLSDPKAHIIFVGYQSEESRGRKILNQEKEIPFKKKLVPLRARVSEVHGFSGHGDQEDLLSWISSASQVPRTSYLVHGEPEGLEALAGQLKERGFDLSIPSLYEKITL